LANITREMFCSVCLHYSKSLNGNMFPFSLKVKRLGRHVMPIMKKLNNKNKFKRACTVFNM